MRGGNPVVVLFLGGPVLVAGAAEGYVLAGPWGALAGWLVVVLLLLATTWAIWRYAEKRAGARIVSNDNLRGQSWKGRHRANRATRRTSSGASRHPGYAERES